MLDFLAEMSDKLRGAFDAAAAAGSLAVFPIVFVAGILASLLPCVYPVIPLTIAYLGAAAAKTKLRAFMLSLTYVLGMSATYALMGAAFFAAKLVFKSTLAFGSWVSHPGLYVGLGGLYLVLGLWMLDVFHFSFGAAKAGAKDRPTGLGGAFLVGMSAGLIVGPCTGPVLAAVIGLALREHVIARAILLMVTYSLGLGLLFLLIGTFSALAARRPKPGRWMVVLKGVFAGAIIVFACVCLVHAGRLWERRSGKVAATLSVVPGDEEPGVGVRLPRMTVPVLTPAGNGWTTRAFDSREITKPVVLVFWATWCAACKEEIPIISSVAKAMGDRIELIAVNREELLSTEQIEGVGIDYPVALDLGGDLSEACGAYTLPWMIITDGQGVIRYFAAAPPKDFEDTLEELLKEQP